MLIKFRNVSCNEHNIFIKVSKHRLRSRTNNFIVNNKIIDLLIRDSHCHKYTKGIRSKMNVILNLSSFYDNFNYLKDQSKNLTRRKLRRLNINFARLFYPIFLFAKCSVSLSQIHLLSILETATFLLLCFLQTLHIRILSFLSDFPLISVSANPPIFSTKPSHIIHKNIDADISRSKKKKKRYASTKSKLERNNEK